MTTKKLNVKINKTGSNNSFLLECIGEYNAGKSSFSPRDLEGYINMKKAYTPITAEGYCLIKDQTDPNTYHISEDGGKTFTLSIEWVEIYSLSEVDKEIETELAGNDDLQNVL